MTLNGAHGNENITMVGTTRLCWVPDCLKEAEYMKYMPKTETNLTRYGMHYFCSHHKPIDAIILEEHTPIGAGPPRK